MEGRPTGIPENRSADVGGRSTVWWSSVAGQFLQGIVPEFEKVDTGFRIQGGRKKSEGVRTFGLVRCSEMCRGEG